MKVFILIFVYLLISAACVPKETNNQVSWQNQWNEDYLPLHIGVSAPQLMSMQIGSDHYIQSWPLRIKKYCADELTKENFKISLILSDGTTHQFNQYNDEQCKNGQAYATLYLDDSKRQLQILLANLNILHNVTSLKLNDRAHLQIEYQNKIFNTRSFPIVKELDIKKVNDYVQFSRKYLDYTNINAVISSLEVKFNSQIPAIWRYVYDNKIDSPNYDYLDPIFRQAKQIKDRYSFPLLKINLIQGNQNIPIHTGVYIPKSKTLVLQFIRDKTTNDFTNSDQANQKIKLEFSYYNIYTNTYILESSPFLKTYLHSPRAPMISLAETGFETIPLNSIPWGINSEKTYRLLIDNQPNTSTFFWVDSLKYDIINGSNFTLTAINTYQTHAQLPNLKELSQEKEPSYQPIYKIRIAYKAQTPYHKEYISPPFAIRSPGLYSHIARKNKWLYTEAVKKSNQLRLYGAYGLGNTAKPHMIHSFIVKKNPNHKILGIDWNELKIDLPYGKYDLILKENAQKLSFIYLPD